METDNSAGVASRQDRPLVSVIVVNYRLREMLRKCLVSLRSNPGVAIDLWVVDNASGDGSVEMLANEFPEARVVANPENVGFAQANNQALARASGDWLVLLNPDTVVPAGALRTITEVFARHPRAGCVGLALRNPDGTAQASCHAFPTVANLLIEALGLHRLAVRLGFGGPMEAPVPRGGEGEVQWVGGACMSLSREAYERVGGLDESTFMYGEEMDWSWRARRHGYVTVYSNRAAVVHHGGAAGAGSEGALFVRNVKARVEFLRRHRGRFPAVIARECMTFGVWIRWLYWSIRAGLEGEVRPRTRVQLERFSAVLAWRRSTSR